ncbi:MAG: sigma-54-dependent Fis family transcriptional regulator, partial [Bacteroidaceae bacterium]|nr:sigma-54-dependent Fis family transcriptional regulator [Bacteroidaceae bacterium]
DAIGYLQTLPYQGNIRELKNIVERALLMKNPEANQLEMEDFSINTMTHESTAFPSDAKSLSDMERSAIAACIAKHNGNLSLVAKELGISRGALYRKIEKYGL